MPTRDIFIALFAASCAYALFLELLKRRYEPNWTWLTVVVGNGLILAALYRICQNGDLPMRAFWIVFKLNIAAGIPILFWQFCKIVQRIRERAARRRGAR